MLTPISRDTSVDISIMATLNSGRYVVIHYQEIFQEEDIRGGTLIVSNHETGIILESRNCTRKSALAVFEGFNLRPRHLGNNLRAEGTIRLKPPESLRIKEGATSP